MDWKNEICSISQSPEAETLRGQNFGPWQSDIKYHTRAEYFLLRLLPLKVSTSHLLNK
jgi:hypothetical protein